MKVFNYKPKSDMKSLFINYWPLLLAVGIAIYAVVSPFGIRVFRVIRIPYPISMILILVICLAVLVYYLFFKMPRLKRDKEHSKPITIDNGVVKYTKVKSGLPKEITFNVNDIKVINVDDDDLEITVADEDITFYSDYFDSEKEYKEFLSALGIDNKD